MVYQEKSSYFVRLKYDTNKENKWQNNVIVSSYSTNNSTTPPTNTFTIFRFDDNYYNTIDSLQYHSNSYLQQNRIFIVKEVNIYMNPIFKKYYRISKFAINSKANPSDPNLWNEFSNSSSSLDDKKYFLNTTINTNTDKTELFRFHLESQSLSGSQNWDNQTEITIPYDLLNLEIFNIEIFGSYIPLQFLENVNIIATNFYHVTIEENTITIFENNFAQDFTEPQQISDFIIRKRTEASFVSKQQSEIGELNFYNVPGKQVTMTIGSGTINHAKISSGGQTLTINNLVVTGGVLSIYNIKDSYENDKILNFYVDVDNVSKNKLPNTSSNRIYIYSESYNHNNIILNNYNPITFTSQNTTASANSIPSQIGKANNVLSTSGTQLVWTKDLNINTLTTAQEVKSDGGFSVADGISNTYGYNFFGSNSALNTGIRYDNTNNKLNIIHDNNTAISINSSEIETNKNLQINYNGDQVNPALKFNNTTTGMYTSPSDTIHFTCDGNKIMSVSPNTITMEKNLNMPDKNITCNQLFYKNIGTDTNSGTIKAATIIVDSISCSSISYTSNNTNIDADSVRTTSIECDSITTFGVTNSVTTGTVNANNIISQGTIRLPQGTVTTPSLRLGNQIGLYQQQTGELNISDGSTEILSISKADGLQCLNISTNSVDTVSLNALNKISVPQGTLSEPSIQFLDKSGMYQTNNGEIKFAVHNNTTDVNELGMTINSDGVVVDKLNANEIRTNNRIFIPRGTKESPSLQFIENSDTGIYQENNTNQLNVSVGGVKKLSVTSLGLDVPSDITCQNTITAKNITCNNTLTSNSIQANTIDATNLNLANNSQINPSIVFGNSEYEINRDGNGNLNLYQQNNLIMKVEPNQTVTLKSVNATSSIECLGNITCPDGTRFVPSIEFGASTGNGIFKTQNEDNINFAVDNITQLQVNSTGLRVFNDIVCDNNIDCENLDCTSNITALTGEFDTATVTNTLILSKPTSSLNNPAIKFGENISIYQASAGQLNIGSGNTELMTLDNSALELKTPNFVTNATIESKGAIILNKGSAAQPALKFENNSGIYQGQNSTNIIFNVDQQDELVINSNEVTIKNNLTCDNLIECSNLDCQASVSTQNLDSDTVQVNTQIKMSQHLENGSLVPASIEFQNGTKMQEASDGSGINIIDNSEQVIFTVSSAGISNINTLECTNLTASNNVTVNNQATINGSIITTDLTSTNVIQIANGSKSIPGLSFSEQTGIYQPEPGKLNIAINSNDIMSVSSSQVFFSESILCDKDISCANLTCSDTITSPNLESDNITVNTQISVSDGNNTNPSVKFSDGTGIYKPSAGKLGFVNNQGNEIASLDETGIITNNVDSQTLNATTINTETINCTGVITSNQLTTQNQLRFDATGDINNPNILFNNGTKIYEKSTGGIVVSKDTTEYLTIDSNGITTTGVNISSGNINCQVINANELTTTGTVTATFIDSKNNIQLNKGSVSQPSLSFADNAGIFQLGAQNLSFTNGQNSLLSISPNPTGITTNNNITCNDLTVTNNINSNTITTNTIDVDEITVNKLNVSESVTISNGLLDSPSLGFSDGSGIYKPLNESGQPISGRIGFTDGTNQLMYIDSSGLNCATDITTQNTIHSTNVTATNVTSTSINSVNVTGTNMTCNSQILVNSDGVITNPAIKFNSNNSGIYKPSSGSIGLSDGTSSVMTVGTGGITFSKNIFCDQDLSCVNLTCNQMTTGNTLTVNTANTNNLNINNILNISKGSLGIPTIQFSDGSGFYQSGNNGIDVSVNQINVCNFTQNGIISPNITSGGGFITNANGSNNNLTFSNSSSSNTGFWINGSTNTVGFTNNGTDSITTSSNNVTINKNLLFNQALVVPDSDSSSSCSIRPVGFSNTGINMTGTDINYYVNGTKIVDYDVNGFNLTSGNIIMPNNGRITVSGDTYANGGIQFVSNNLMTIRSPNTASFHGFQIGTSGSTSGVGIFANGTNMMQFTNNLCQVRNSLFRLNNTTSLTYELNNLSSGQTLATTNLSSHMHIVTYNGANCNLSINTGVAGGHYMKVIVPANSLYTASIMPNGCIIRMINGSILVSGSTASIVSSGTAGAVNILQSNIRLTLINNRVYEFIYSSTDTAWHLAMISAQMI